MGGGPGRWGADQDHRAQLHPVKHQQSRQEVRSQFLHGGFSQRLFAYPDATNIEAGALRVASNRTRTGGRRGGGASY